MLQSCAQNRTVPSCIKEILVGVDPQIDTQHSNSGRFQYLSLTIDRASGKKETEKLGSKMTPKMKMVLADAL